MEQVHQSVVILSRKILDKATKGSLSGKAANAKAGKVLGLSVVTPARPTATSGSSDNKGSKMLPGDELRFLCEFAVDIVYSVTTFLEALRGASAMLTSTSLFW